MYLLPKCVDELKYSVFWESMDEPSLKKFLDFRLKANNLKDKDTEHRQYKTELEIIQSYHGKNSEIGAKANSWLNQFKNDKSSDQINHFWNLQLKRQNILVELKLLEDKCKLLEKKRNELENQICREQIKLILDATKKTVGQGLFLQKSIVKRFILDTEQQIEEVETLAEFKTPKDDEEIKTSIYDTFPAHIHKRPEPNPSFVSSQGTKRDRDVEEEEDGEYNADQTIIGGKGTDWIVNGVRIRESLTQYQLDKNPPKTKSEYYDVIFFNSNDKDGFLSTLDEIIVEQMRSDIRRNEEKTKDNIEQDIKIFLDNIIDRDIKITKEKLKQQKEEHIASFGKVFALEFVSHMIKLMENVNWLIEPMSEETYIVNVLAPILSEFFTKNKQYWCASYGETCLRASARGRNSNKADDERRYNGKKIDTIISLREEDKEFSVIEVSGPPMKNDWAHFKGDRMKIAKMLKTLMNQFAELNPTSDITLIRLYGLQSYLNELTIYEFQLKYTEIYTMEIILTFPLPKRWADMTKAHKTVMGLLEYERLLLESMETIKDFMWSKGGSKKMTTRMINSIESVEKTKSTITAKKTKKARI
ncbi:7177_t:CDS:2 [Acaulospora morrowiae]|uniref:7177_t:CDS:1 n=1 Tax=Acaulospora morrowiae TaxID=94023 RepID=A0A9N9GS33_9GLOM|nr:7177_t:CDS:2 [Acaulospora morrowiae]